MDAFTGDSQQGPHASKLMDGKAKRIGRTVEAKTLKSTATAIDGHSRAQAALEILKQVRRLRLTAEKADLRMVLYLLDMAALEAEDQLTSPAATQEGR